MKSGRILKTSSVILGLSALMALPMVNLAADGGAETKTVKGEIVDLMCYLDHGAKGEKHASCAQKCIKNGGPVGLLTSDGDVYLVIGEHKPMNEELASKAAQTITLKGKVVERHGMKMIENAQIIEQ
jgi:hypothetical protein